MERDVGKIKYEAKKKRSLRKKTQVVNSLKEITMGLNCGPGDLDTKMKKAVEFLEDGHLVKLTVRLRGRQKAKPQMAADLLDRLVQNLTSVGKLANGPPKTNGFMCFVVLAPTPSSSQKASAKRKKFVNDGSA